MTDGARVLLKGLFALQVLHQLQTLELISNFSVPPFLQISFVPMDSSLV